MKDIAKLVTPVNEDDVEQLVDTGPEPKEEPINLQDYMPSESDSLIQKVFEELVAPVNYRLRWIVVCLGLLIFIFNIVSLSGLTARESQENILKGSNPLQKGINWYWFGLWQDGGLYVKLMWGIEPAIAVDP